MKRFILRVLLFMGLFLLLSSQKCGNKGSYVYIFEKTYSLEQENRSHEVLDSLLHSYDLDTIPFTKWITLIMSNPDSTKIIQRGIHSKDYSVIFTYNTYVLLDSAYYEIKVRKFIEK